VGFLGLAILFLSFFKLTSCRHLIILNQ